jgi:hypothetical protein
MDELVEWLVDEPEAKAVDDLEGKPVNNGK